MYAKKKSALQIVLCPAFCVYCKENRRRQFYETETFYQSGYGKINLHEWTNFPFCIFVCNGKGLSTQNIPHGYKLKWISTFFRSGTFR